MPRDTLRQIMEENKPSTESSNKRSASVNIQPPLPAGRKTLRSRIGLAVVSLILAFAGAEIAVRFLWPLASPLRFEQVQQALDETLENQFGFDQTQHSNQRVRSLVFDDIFQSDPELFWKFAPNVRLPDDHWPMFGLVSNGQGLREDHEIPRQKQPGEIRILFVGDSCTYGLLLPHTETVCHLTEVQLRAAYPELKIEAINAGVPAYSLYQGWRFLVTQGPRYQPDLIVLNFGWNAAGMWDGQSDIEHYDQWKSAQPPGPLRHSRLCQMIWAIPRADESNGQARRQRPRLLPKEYRNLLGKVHQTTEEQGIDLLLLVGAGRFNIDPSDEITKRTFFHEEGMRYGRRIRFGADGVTGLVDVVPIVQAMANTIPASDLFHDNIHPTAQTNREIAKALVKKLQPWIDARRKSGE